MKIIHITASYKPAYIYGGPIQSVGKLCEVLEELSDNRLAFGAGNLNVQVLTTTANGTNELDVKTGIPILVERVWVTYFKRWTKDHSHFSPALLWELRRMIIRQAQDERPNIENREIITPEQPLKEPKSFTAPFLKDKNIIHIHAWWNLVSVLSCSIAKWYRVPVVLSPRGMLTSYTLGNRNSFSKMLIHRLLGKNLLKYCHIHATSEQEKADILRIVTPKSIRVIPNLVNLSLEKQDCKSSASSIEDQKGSYFKLIFLSRIEEKKGLELLFTALAAVDIPWTLTIAGSGEEAYVQVLKLTASELKISDKINWIGQVSNEDKYSLIAAHHLLVLTSYNENFANVVVESLGVGTSVLLSKKVGLSDYVKDKGFGWVTDLDPASIQTSIIAAYLAVEKRQNIRTTAPLTISSDFNDYALANQYLEFYKTI